MRGVKIIIADNYFQLEAKINKWVAENTDATVCDIKLPDVQYIAMIIYKRGE